MKIRIKGNSIRYRLTKSEVAIFCATGYFEDYTQFIETTFTYALRINDAIKAMDAIYKENKICIQIAKELIKDWASNNKIGFQHDIALGTCKVLSILVEKDFICMDCTTEDQSDNYPNPVIDKQ